MVRFAREDNDIALPSTSSQVVSVDQWQDDRHELMRQAAACYEQTIQSINVIDSEDVHVGPRFISVSQNVQNNEVTAGSILGVQVVSTQSGKPLRCSVAVFVCWSFVVAAVLLIFILYMAFSKKPTRIDIDINEPWYLRRIDWGANAERGIQLLNLPVPKVIIGHSVLEFCTDKYSCIGNVLNMQKSDMMDKRWDDIGPNFLVGGQNGYVFEGRGANILSSMVKGFTDKSITIMFLGNYVHDKPTMAMFDNLNVLLKELVKQRVLTTDYLLYGQCQLIGATVQPGPNVVENLHNFEHWDPTNRTSCYRPY